MPTIEAHEPADAKPDPEPCLRRLAPPQRPLSPRLQELRRRVIAAPNELGMVRVREVTNAARSHPELPRIEQLALGIREAMRKLPVSISEGERIVGKSTEKFKGASMFPELRSDTLIKELDNLGERVSMRFVITGEEKRELRDEILPFWEGKSGFDRWLEGVGEDSDLLMRNLAFVAYNDLNGAGALSYVDYGKVLEEGYEGIIRETRERMGAVSGSDAEAERRRSFYRAVILGAEGVIALADSHSRLALELAQEAQTGERAEELREIAEIAARVPARPARTFREALQSAWFTFCGLQQLDMPMEVPLGRVDQYLYPFYLRDIQDGALTRAEAQELVDEFHIKLNQVMFLGDFALTQVIDGNSTRFTITIGGVGADGRDVTNDLSHLFLEAADSVRLLHPNMACRLHPRTPERFFREVVRVLTNGSNVIQVFNDEIIVESFTRLGFSVEDARDYLITGCIQPVTKDMYGPTCSVFLNAPKALELFLNGGKPMLSLDGADVEDLPSPRFATFEEFLGAFERHYAGIAERAVSEARRVAWVEERETPNPQLSALVGGALEAGRDVKAGGARNNATGVAVIGHGTLVDSLAAIQEVVFRTQAHSLEDVVGWLKTDFEDQEAERLMLQNKAPKFGNGDPRADAIARELADFLDEVLLGLPRTPRGGLHVQSMHSEMHHVYQGAVVAASADGRRAGTRLSPGCGPVSGADKEGPTASMRSVCAMDFTKFAGGVSYNQRYNPRQFDTAKGVEAFGSLLKSYFFQLGGQHLHLSAVDTETLRDAQRHPENYQDLLVRVTGYSARFVEMTLPAQEEIIARSEAGAC